MREGVECPFPCQGKGFKESIMLMKKKGRTCFNNGSFFKRAGPCVKNLIQQNLPDPNVLTALSRRPLEIADDKMFESNESVKGALIEGSSENLDAFKIIEEKIQLEDHIAIKDTHRTTCAEYAFKIIFIIEVVVEVDDFPFKVQSRAFQISSHFIRTRFTQVVVTL